MFYNVNGDNGLSALRSSAQLFDRVWLPHRVRFVHRSAFDFLQDSPNAEDFLQQDKASESSLRTILVKAGITIVGNAILVERDDYFLGPPLHNKHRLRLRSWWWLEWVNLEIHSCMHIIADAQEDLLEEYYSLLDELENRVNVVLPRYAAELTRYVRHPGLTGSFLAERPLIRLEYRFLQSAIQNGLLAWAESRVRIQHLDSVRGLYFDLMISQFPWSDPLQFQRSLRLARKLLEAGLSPNQFFEPTCFIKEPPYRTPWTMFLCIILLGRERISEEDLPGLVSIIKGFVSYGAGIDETASVDTSHREDSKDTLSLFCSPLCILTILFAGTDEGNDLQHFMMEKGAHEFPFAVFENRRPVFGCRLI